jgi:hypothetical protein
LGKNLSRQVLNTEPMFWNPFLPPLFIVSYSGHLALKHFFFLKAYTLFSRLVPIGSFPSSPAFASPRVILSPYPSAGDPQPRVLGMASKHSTAELQPQPLTIVGRRGRNWGSWHRDVVLFPVPHYLRHYSSVSERL